MMGLPDSMDWLGCPTVLKNSHKFSAGKYAVYSMAAAELPAIFNCGPLAYASKIVTPAVPSCNHSDPGQDGL
eukprot:3547019-Amphidinium_carterae.1